MLLNFRKSLRTNEWLLESIKKDLGKLVICKKKVNLLRKKTNEFFLIVIIKLHINYFNENS